MSEAAHLGRAIATAGYFSLAFGLMFAITIANRHLFSPIRQHRLPAIATLCGAIILACLSLLLPEFTPGWAAIEIVAFAALLWGLLTLARMIDERRTGTIIALATTAFGTVCTRAIDYVG